MVWVLLVLCLSGLVWLASLEKRVTALQDGDRQRRDVEARRRERADAEEMLRAPFDPAKGFQQAHRLQVAATDGVITFEEFCRKLDSLCDQQDAFERTGGTVSFSFKEAREATREGVVPALIMRRSRLGGEVVRA